MMTSASLPQKSTDSPGRLVEKLIAGLLVALFMTPALGDQPLVKVGVAKVDVTPRGPVLLAGYGGRQGEHQGIDTPLWARALVIGDKDPVAIVVVDNCGVPADLCHQLGVRIAQHGIPADRLVVSATHTHNAPTLVGYAPVVWAGRATEEQEGRVRAYTAYLLDKMEEALRIALKKRQPMSLGWAQGRATFGGNRRVLRDGRWAGFGYQRSGPVDHSLPVLFAKDSKGVVRAVWANYACHCTTVGSRNRVGGDWAGFANDGMEKKLPGAVALMTIGCGADVGPQPSGDLKIAEQHGQQIANEVHRLGMGKLTPLEAAPTVVSKSIRLPLAATPKREYWTKQLAKGGFYAQQAKLILKRLGDKDVGGKTVPYSITTWKFDRRLAMVFLGGEVVVDYSVRLNRELDWKRLWITAWSNSMPGYIPSRRVLEEGGYEADFSQVYYARAGGYAPAIEDLIVSNVKSMVGGQFVAAATQSPSTFHKPPSGEAKTFQRLEAWAKKKDKPVEEQKILIALKEMVTKVSPAFAKIDPGKAEKTEWFNFAGDTAPRYFIRQQTTDAVLSWKTPPLPKNRREVVLAFSGGLGWKSEPMTDGFVLEVNGKQSVRFDITLKPKQWRSSDSAVELTYLPTWHSNTDSAGFFFLRLKSPTPNKEGRLAIAVRSRGKGSKRWFAVEQDQAIPASLAKISKSLGVESVIVELQVQAAKLSARCPLKIDDATTLTKCVAGPGKRFNYVYEISVQLTDDQKQAITKTVRARASAAPKLKPLFDKGVILAYRYFDKKGKLQLEFEVKPPTKGDDL